eukprot:GEMP01057353.1.p1 GENE.GEMP01057353.1~~GEMP01057353.1.p1  ORF type:complete len:234 (+),score=29.48 GEMP01057353.1:221-922(+)
MHRDCAQNCLRMFRVVDMCRAAREDPDTHLSEARAQELYGLDFCKFLAEIAIGTRYRKPVLDSKYMYRHGSALPRTNVKRDDYMWGQVLTMEACSNSSNPECFPRLNASYYIQETLDEWFYQPCRGELGCHLPDHQPPNSQEDLTNFLENGIGHQCKEYADDMAFAIANNGTSRGCADMCLQVCSDACECHFGDARYAAYSEGRGSEFQWSMNAADRHFSCYERQLGGQKAKV